MLQRCSLSNVRLPGTRNDSIMPNDHRATLRIPPLRGKRFALVLALLVATGGFLAETASGEEQRGQRRGKRGMNAAQHNARGVELIGEDKFEEALASFESALQLDPKMTQAHFNKGLVHWNLAQLDDAISSYGEAVQLDPEYAEAHFRLGQALFGKRRIEECIAALQRAVEVDPLHAEAYLALGNVLATEGRVQESVAALEKSIEANPEDAGPHYALGNIWGQLGDVDEAVKAYGEVVRLTPDNADAHFRLAVSLYGGEEYADAWKHVHQAQDLDFSVPEPFLDALRQEMREPKRNQDTT